MTYEEAKEALQGPLMLMSDQEAFEAVRTIARGLPAEDARVYTASMDIARRTGYKEGLSERISSSITNNYNYMNNNNNNNNNTNNNSGQQMGVNVGSGKAVVKHSNQSSAGGQAPDVFDQDQFRVELIEVLGLIVDRIETIEGDAASAGQVLIALRKADLSQAKTIEDVRAMLEDIWDDQMKAKYSTLRALFASDGALVEIIKGAGQVAKVLGPILA